MHSKIYKEHKQKEKDKEKETRETKTPEIPKISCRQRNHLLPSMPQAKSPFHRRPPLAASPRRTRSGRILFSTPSIQSPPGPYLTRTQVPNLSKGLEESRIRPEWVSMSCDFQALAKMVEEELGCLGTPFTSSSITNYSPLFERGRMYEEYSARRNERLKRKKRETEEGRYVHDSGAPLESGKRRIVKKVESVRKSAPASFSIGNREGLRSSARINKENMKPPVSGYGKRLEEVDGDCKKRTGAWTGRRN